MRIVITGSQGFIGSHLLRRLQQDGLEVLGVGRATGPSEGPWGSRYHSCDLSDPTRLLPADCQDQPFTLIHLAWDTTRPRQYRPHAEHVSRLAGLLDYWAPRGLRRLVAVGSAEEYGQRGGRIREEDPAQGTVTPYGWSKRSARTLAQSWSEATGIPVVWLCPFLVYGPGQGGNMAIPYAVRQGRVGAPAEFSDGQQQRDFVYINDVVEAFRRACRADLPGFHVFNIGTGVAVCVRDVLEYLGERFGAQSQFYFGRRPRREGEPAVQIAVTDKARELLGWKARVPWREGVCRIVDTLGKPETWTA
jgi:nucleoside-diphosphate-sugar epimerase